jgi:hypothetical protein
MGVIRRRDAGIDIKELPDPRLARQKAHRPAQKCPIRAGPDGRVGVGLQGLITDLTVGGKVVLPAEQIVIYPGLVGNAGVNVRRLLTVVGNRAFEASA